MDLAKLYFQMGLFKKENIKIVFLLDMEKWFFIIWFNKEYLKTLNCMEKEK
jgi:hypothetical protein